MPERTLDWGGDNSPYETHFDRDSNGRLIVAEDTSTGGSVLLEYDESANAGAGGWISRGPVEMSGNDVTGVGSLTANSVETETLATDYHYAGAYDGADPDARLDNALSAATTGDHIYLESEPYSSDRTISTRLMLYGDGTFPTSGTRIDGDYTWTFEQNCILYGVSAWPSTNDYTVIDFQISCWYLNAHNPFRGDFINVNGNNVTIQGVKNGGVVYQSGTSGGLVDGCMNVSVTDNGSNTVGDIA